MRHPMKREPLRNASLVIIGETLLKYNILKGNVSMIRVLNMVFK